MFWLSLTDNESEANPNTNLMMRRAGLSRIAVYLTGTEAGDKNQNYFSCLQSDSAIWNLNFQKAFSDGR